MAFKDRFIAMCEQAELRGAALDVHDGDDALRLINRVHLAQSSPHDDGTHLPPAEALDLLETHRVAAGEVARVLEAIIERSEMLGTEFLIRGAKATSAVGMVTVRRGGKVLGTGTGWMCGKDLLITNNHVLGDEEMAEASTVRFNFFDLAGIPQPPNVSKLRPDLFFVTDEDLDYTIVATERAMSFWLPLIPESGKLLVGERANVIHHPGGGSQQVSIRGNSLVGVDGPWRHYWSDTEAGSSGAVVCNDQWQPAALHHAGIPATDSAGNILLIDGSRWDGTLATVSSIRWEKNEGVAISHVIWNALYDKGLEGARLDRLCRALTGPRWP